MRNAVLALVALLVTTSAATAEPLSPDAVKQLVTTLTEPVRDTDPPPPAAKAAVVAGLATPFWYDGLEYGALDEAAARRCKKAWKRAGTIKAAARVPAFVDCLQVALFSGSLDGDAEWHPVDVKKLPRVFKKHRKKLAKLAKDHTLVASHFIPAGPAEYWALWIVTPDRKLAGMLVVNDD